MSVSKNHVPAIEANVPNGVVHHVDISPAEKYAAYFKAQAKKSQSTFSAGSIYSIVGIIIVGSVVLMLGVIVLRHRYDGGARNDFDPTQIMSKIRRRLPENAIEPQ